MNMNKNKFVLLIIKTVIIIGLVFAALFGLNAKMTKFNADEAAKQEEIQLLQADYDRANEDYYIQDHYDGQFQEIFEKRVNADYIFIGTSHVTHGVTPEEFEKSGKKFFNFALNGATPSYYVWWYNDVFKPDKYVKPKAIIMGVDWFMFDSDWLWRRPEYDYQYIMNRVPKDPPGADNSGSSANQNSNTAALKYTGKWYDVDALMTYITNRFPVFSSREKFIDIFLPENKNNNNADTAFVPAQKEKTQKAYRITPDGFVLSSFYKGYVPWKWDYDGTSVGEVRTTYHAEEESAFVLLLKQFKDDGIPVVFVMTPEYLPGRDAPQFDRMVKIIQGIADERNIPFLNYNTDLKSEINTDYTCYSDWGHLNDKGAHLFSKKLYDDLNKILDFTG